MTAVLCVNALLDRRDKSEALVGQVSNRRPICTRLVAGFAKKQNGPLDLTERAALERHRRPRPANTPVRLKTGRSLLRSARTIWIYRAMHTITPPW